MYNYYKNVLSATTALAKVLTTEIGRYLMYELVMTHDVHQFERNRHNVLYDEGGRVSRAEYESMQYVMLIDGEERGFMNALVAHVMLAGNDFSRRFARKAILNELKELHPEDLNPDDYESLYRL